MPDTEQEITPVPTAGRVAPRGCPCLGCSARGPEEAAEASLDSLPRRLKVLRSPGRHGPHMGKGPGWPEPSAGRAGWVLVLTQQGHGAGGRDPNRTSLRAPTSLSMTRAAIHYHSHSHSQPTLPHSRRSSSQGWGWRQAVKLRSKTELRKTVWQWEGRGGGMPHGLTGMGL